MNKEKLTCLKLRMLAIIIATVGVFSLLFLLFGFLYLIISGNYEYIAAFGTAIFLGWLIWGLSEEVCDHLKSRKKR
ncbi:MAG: hypothetical protein ACRC6E_10905 [Fusobacteriaceae bacterium]